MYVSWRFIAHKCVCDYTMKHEIQDLLSRWLCSDESDVTVKTVFISCPLMPVSLDGQQMRVCILFMRCLRISLSSAHTRKEKHIRSYLFLVLALKWEWGRLHFQDWQFYAAKLKRTLWISEIIACNLPLMDLSVITGCLHQPYQWQGRGERWNEMSIILA